MRVLLEFQLPEESEELRLAESAMEMHSALWHFRELLRKRVHAGDVTPECQQLLADVFADLTVCLESAGVEL